MSFPLRLPPLPQNADTHKLNIISTDKKRTPDKILEEVKTVRRFQLVQKTENKLELRLTAEDINEAFEIAKRDLLAFFESKGLSGIDITLSDIPPKANKISGKFKHIYSELS